MTRIAERAYPVASGVAVSMLVAWLSHHGWRTSSSVADLFKAGIEIGAIAIGFIGTYQTILISIDDRDIIKRIKELGKYESLLSYTFAALRWWGLLVVMSAIGVLVYGEPRPSTTPSRLISIWTGLCVTAILCWVRLFFAFSSILRADSGGSGLAEREISGVNPRDPSKARSIRRD
jgi:hypothetical protein